MDLLDWIFKYSKESKVQEIVIIEEEEKIISPAKKDNKESRKGDSDGSQSSQ